MLDVVYAIIQIIQMLFFNIQTRDYTIHLIQKIFYDDGDLNKQFGMKTQITKGLPKSRRNYFNGEESIC